MVRNMAYKVTWTDKKTGAYFEADHGSDVDAACRDANTKSNLHCSAVVLNLTNGEVVGSLSYSFGRRGEEDGDM